MPGHFPGFPGGRVRITPLPAAFFTDLLTMVDHLGELKVSLYAFWFLDRQEGTLRFLRYTDFSEDSRLLSGFSDDLVTAQTMLAEGLERAVKRGTLLKAPSPDGTVDRNLYFLNSPRGRAALKGLQAGDWSPDDVARPGFALQHERPNVYRLYEENIGPLTPLIADTLRDAENTYPPDWIEEAITKAVENNVRTWRYIQAILRSWKEKGHDDTYRRDSQKDRRRYLQDEFADFIEK